MEILVQQERAMSIPGGGGFPGGGGLPGGRGGGPPKSPEPPAPAAQPVDIEFTPTPPPERIEPPPPAALDIDFSGGPLRAPNLPKIETPKKGRKRKKSKPATPKPRAMALQVSGDIDKVEVLAGKAVVFEYIYGILGLLLGATGLILGALLCLNGVVGSTSWTMKVLGAESEINDALPGVVFAVVGFFMVWVTKPKVRLKK
jgi:hypothetical protein